jgi:hypothetical protein
LPFAPEVVLADLLLADLDDVPFAGLGFDDVPVAAAVRVVVVAPPLVADVSVTDGAGAAACLALPVPLVWPTPPLAFAVAFAFEPAAPPPGAARAAPVPTPSHATVATGTMATPVSHLLRRGC